MHHNGPAIWGGCVTRRKHRAGSWYFSQKTVTVQGGYGALFAVRVQILLNITSVALQGWSEPRTYPRLQIWWRALAQCRGTNYLGARNLSRCRILIACRCACPGAATITKLSWVQEQKQKVWQTTYPYCPCYRAFIFSFNIYRSSSRVLFHAIISFLLTSTNQNCYVSVILYTTCLLQLFRWRFYDL